MSCHSFQGLGFSVRVKHKKQDELTYVYQSYIMNTEAHKRCQQTETIIIQQVQNKNE